MTMELRQLLPKVRHAMPAGFYCSFHGCLRCYRALRSQPGRVASRSVADVFARLVPVT